MYVLIKPHKHPGSCDIIKCPDGTPAHLVVEQWQRGRPSPNGQPAACTWKVAEGNGWVGAMIESTTFRKVGAQDD